jgi:hypothetical protein
MITTNLKTNSCQKTDLTKKQKSKSGIGISKRKNAGNDLLSFGGYSDTSSKLAKNIAQGLPEFVYKNKTMKKFLDLAGKSPAIFEAITAFIVTATLRPMAILTMPGAEKRDKQYASAQSIASGFTGLFLTTALVYPINKAIDKISDMAKKGEKFDFLLEKNILLKKYNTPQLAPFRFSMDYGSKFILAPITAIAMIESIPFFMKKLFPKKAQEKNNKAKLNNTEYVQNTYFNRALFKGFIHDKKASKVSFGGSTGKTVSDAIEKIYSPVTNLITKGFERLLDNTGFRNFLKDSLVEKKTFKNGVKKVHTLTDKMQDWMSPVIANWMTGFYILDTYKSKKIEPERKNTLAVNMAFVSTFSTVAGFALNGFFNSFRKEFMKKYLQTNFDQNEQLNKFVKDEGVQTKLKEILGKEIKRAGLDTTPEAELAGAVKRITDLSNTSSVKDVLETVSKYLEINGLEEVIGNRIKEVKNKTELEQLSELFDNLAKNQTAKIDDVFKKSESLLGKGFMEKLTEHIQDLEPKKITKLFDDLHVKFNTESLYDSINKLSKTERGVKWAVGLVSFTLAFRFLGPVLAAPAADKITKFLQEKGIMKKPETKHA